MSEADCAGLITAARRYLNAPIIVIWDNRPRTCAGRCGPSPPATRA